MADDKSPADVTREFEAANALAVAEATYKKAPSTVDLNATLKKFSVGDGLTDDELGALIDLFTRLEYDLMTLTQHYDAGFGLAHKEARRNLQTLESFKYVRERERSL